MGWINKNTKYCQTIRTKNLTKRFDHAIGCIQSNENFNNIVFTDESTIKIQTSARRTMYKRNEPEILKGKPKHPLQLHVWAGISRRGATDIHIFTGKMDSMYYQSILEKTLIPFGESVYSDGYRLMQDNDPKHVSISTKAFLKEKNITHWPTPPESPDMNPIENMWAALKEHIRKVKKPRNKAELIEGIQEFWSTVTPEMCNRYINHLFRVIPEVVRRNGGATMY